MSQKCHAWHKEAVEPVSAPNSGTDFGGRINNVATYKVKVLSEMNLHNCYEVVFHKYDGMMTFKLLPMFSVLTVTKLANSLDRISCALCNKNALLTTTIELANEPEDPQDKP